LGLGQLMYWTTSSTSAVLELAWVERATKQIGSNASTRPRRDGDGGPVSRDAPAHGGPRLGQPTRGGAAAPSPARVAAHAAAARPQPVPASRRAVATKTHGQRWHIMRRPAPPPRARLARAAPRPDRPVRAGCVGAAVRSTGPRQHGQRPRVVKDAPGLPLPRTAAAGHRAPPRHATPLPAIACELRSGLTRGSGRARG
jgi:hypothetical protein